MKIEIYGKDNCPNCDTAAMLSKKNDFNVSLYKMGKDFEIPEMMTRIGKRVAAFPQIFVNDEYIGSLNEYKTYLDNLLNEEDNLSDDLDELSDLDL